jgi:hypothetical protein
VAHKSSPRSDPRPSSAATSESTKSSSEVIEGLAAWFQSQLPHHWFVEPIRVEVDRDEIIVTGVLAEPSIANDTIANDTTDDTNDAERFQIIATLIARFREETRAHRVAVALQAEALLARKVSWAVECGAYRDVFTNVSVPVMTRLRFSERQVLDALVDASVARTRSEALSWCVRLVGQHHGDWVTELREAMVEVERVRSRGPRA